MSKLALAFVLASLTLSSIILNDSEAHFMGTGIFIRDYYIVFTTIPDFPAPKEPSVLAFTIADAKTLGHIPDADVIIKVKQGEKVISTFEEEYMGYDVFVGYTFQDEGQYKVILEMNIPNDPQPVTAEFDVTVQQKQDLAFKPIDAPITSVPSGNMAIQPNHFFEVGVMMDAGETIQYSYSADAPVFFDLHLHEGTSVTDYLVIEASERNGSFTAPRAGNYYFLWENLGNSETKIRYDISFPRSTKTINYEDQSYEITFVSNSKIESITFDQPAKQILLKIKTPFLTPSFINMTIPKSLLDGSFDVMGGSAQFIVTESESASILLINTDDGTHDITIAGTTVVPEVPYPLIIFTFALFTLMLLARSELPMP